MDRADRIEVLEAENQRLRDQLEALEEAFGLVQVWPVEWRLTGQEGRIVGALLHREHCTKDALMAACYRDYGKDEPEIKIIDVFVCKVRKKLKPFGISIETLRAIGYAMPKASKDVVKAALEGKA